MAENLYRTVTKEEREAAWAECRMMYQHDIASMREDGRKAGLAEGRAEGEAIGAAQKQREIAKNMKEKNIPTADIVEITGLSVEEIEKL